jgi:membrane protease YdiL (CAAX protease family)
MSNLQLNIKKIKKLAIRGLGWGYIPFTIIALIDSLLKNIPGSEVIIDLFSLFAFFSLLYGYGICAYAADLYSEYKGYKNHFYIYYKFLFGCFKKIDFKLPIGLTIVQYLFDWGINSITLYDLSFVIPKYVESQINREYATTPFGWICFSIGAVLFAPLMEELLFRGIIVQKLALQKNIIKALLISAIAFALIHFRYDVIPLFITGIIYALLYLKTKQLAVPILCHFFHNLIVVVRNIAALSLAQNSRESLQQTEQLTRRNAAAIARLEERMEQYIVEGREHREYIAIQVDGIRVETRRIIQHLFGDIDNQ